MYGSASLLSAFDGHISAMTVYPSPSSSSDRGDVFIVFAGSFKRLPNLFVPRSDLKEKVDLRLNRRAIILELQVMRRSQKSKGEVMSSCVSLLPQLVSSTLRTLDDGSWLDEWEGHTFVLFKLSDSFVNVKILVVFLLFVQAA